MRCARCWARCQRKSCADLIRESSRLHVAKVRPDAPRTASPTGHCVREPGRHAPPTTTPTPESAASRLARTAPARGPSFPVAPRRAVGNSSTTATATRGLAVAEAPAELVRRAGGEDGRPTGLLGGCGAPATHRGDDVRKTSARRARAFLDSSTGGRPPGHDRTHAKHAPRAVATSRGSLLLAKAHRDVARIRRPAVRLEGSCLRNSDSHYGLTYQIVRSVHAPSRTMTEVGAGGMAKKASSRLFVIC